MATIYQQTVRPNGPTFNEDASGGVPTIVGSAPQWGDQSDATYCVIPCSLTSGGNLSERSSAAAQLAAATVPWPAFTVTLRIRLSASATLPRPAAWLRSGGALIYENAVGGGASPTAPAWIEMTLNPLSGGAAALVSALAAGSLQVLIRSPFAFGAGPDGSYSITVYEVEVLVDKVVVSSMAPPCRNIKRGDRLDLGGARNYPPSKMQQTSSRGVGAY